MCVVQLIVKKNYVVQHKKWVKKFGAEQENALTLQHFRKTGRPWGRRWREKFIEEIEEASVVQEIREKEVNSVR